MEEKDCPHREIEKDTAEDWFMDGILTENHTCLDCGKKFETAWEYRGGALF